MGSGRWWAGFPAVLVAVLVLLAGCGGGGGSPAQPPPLPTPPATPEAWTEAVCAALVPVVARVTAAPGLDLNAPEATRQAFLVYLDESTAVTDQARAELALAGPAPVPGGDVIAEQVRGDVADLRANLTAARVQVERTDTGSAVAIGRAAYGVSKVVSALLNGAEVAATINRDPTLEAAYNASPSCAQLRPGAPPSPPPTDPPSEAVVPTR